MTESKRFWPTTARPGSEQKRAVLAKRAAFCLPLFHPADSLGPPADWPEEKVRGNPGNTRADREDNYRRFIEANP